MKRELSHIQLVTICYNRIIIYADLHTNCKHGIDSIVMSRKILLKEDVTFCNLVQHRKSTCMM